MIRNTSKPEYLLLCIIRPSPFNTFSSSVYKYHNLFNSNNHLLFLVFSLQYRFFIAFLHGKCNQKRQRNIQSIYIAKIRKYRRSNKQSTPNTQNGNISDQVPVLFCHAMLKKAKKIYTKVSTKIRLLAMNKSLYSLKKFPLCVVI